jgi:hypothetical protein
MQEILPLCMQHLMIKGYRMAIIWLCQVFKQLCAKVVDLAMMGELKNEAIMTLMLLERKFPPCFDIITHLLVHLVEELELCEPIHTRWMYFVEWYLKTLKGICGKYNLKVVRKKICTRGSTWVLSWIIWWILQP